MQFMKITLFSPDEIWQFPSRCPGETVRQEGIVSFQMAGSDFSLDQEVVLLNLVNYIIIKEKNG